jgi:FtsP/CotA-like multicopper oxidase with cupredoxin domain
MSKTRENQFSRRDFLRLGVTVSCGLVVPPILSSCLGEDSYQAGPTQTFVNPQVIQSVDGVLDITLSVSYFTTQIGDTKVTLRSYGNFTGPTLIVNVGDTLRIKLVNQLPPNPPDPDPTVHLRYHNNTNTHAHGLHVYPGIISPGLYGDYVMDPSDGGVEPGQTRQYQYQIREDHPTGMFWYHPHVHGQGAGPGHLLPAHHADPNGHGEQCVAGEHSG